MNKDPMMDAINAKRGGLVLKITIDPVEGNASVEPDTAGMNTPKVTDDDGDESQMVAGNGDMAPPNPNMDEEMTAGMSDYDKEQAMGGPQKSLGMKAKQAALERLKMKG